MTSLIEHSRVRPTLALRVGFIGHRDVSADQQAVTRQISTLLHTIGQHLISMPRTEYGYNEQMPVLSFVNSLAEGADQLAARAVITFVEESNDAQLACQLFVPLPFDEESYLGHFEVDADNARRCFRELTRHPQLPVHQVVLDGAHADPKQRSQSYREAADLLLDNSDLLIAVCDKTRPEKPGGSIETVHKALLRNIPIIVVNPSSGAAYLQICDKHTAECEKPIEQLAQLLNAILQLCRKVIEQTDATDG